MVMFKRKKKPNVAFPRFHKSGWMDEDGVRLWIDNVWNKPFKDHMHEEWMQWMSNGQKTYTVRGCMRAPPLELLCEFVVKAWKKTNADTVMKSFRKCYISKASEGREDVDQSDTDESG
ncbi:hypothetical protein M514_09265 [Trichuris suis]|uniref:DDE-1 domain-containing protein n=1 Tax=Trichuris suis TaxID=68888 RepID=A0A085MUR2_9BILA|nr:hypothetical protein M514_09265 [Trichuris suis]